MKLKKPTAIVGVLLVVAPTLAHGATPSLSKAPDGGVAINVNKLKYDYKGNLVGVKQLLRLQKSGKARHIVYAESLAVQGRAMAFDSEAAKRRWYKTGGAQVVRKVPAAIKRIRATPSKVKTLHSCAFTYTAAAARMYDGDSCTSGYVAMPYDTTWNFMPSGWNNRVNSIKLHQYGTAPCGPQVNVNLYDLTNIVAGGEFVLSYWASNGTSYNLLNAYKNKTSSAWGQCG